MVAEVANALNEEAGGEKGSANPTESIIQATVGMEKSVHCLVHQGKYCIVYQSEPDAGGQPVPPNLGM